MSNCDCAFSPSGVLKKKLYTHKYITACKYELGIHSFKSVLCIFFKQNETLAMKFKQKTACGTIVHGDVFYDKIVYYFDFVYRNALKTVDLCCKNIQELFKRYIYKVI